MSKKKRTSSLGKLASSERAGSFLSRKPRSLSQGDLPRSQSQNVSKIDRRESLGERVSIPGQGIYEGEVVQGLRHGNGRLLSPDETYIIYDGEWQSDKPSGFGVRNFASGDIHRGHYLNGRRHGVGVYGWTNGDQYDGNWKDNRQHGYGTFHWATGESYVGEWVHGAMTGSGEKIQLDGSVVEGNFQDGKAHGIATKSFISGERYKGQYVSDRKHGFGQYDWPDGCSYKGQWKGDLMTGFGLKATAVPSTSPQRARARELAHSMDGDPVSFYT